jgi:hypothetical protein
VNPLNGREMITLFCEPLSYTSVKRRQTLLERNAVPARTRDPRASGGVRPGDSQLKTKAYWISPAPHSTSFATVQKRPSRKSSEQAVTALGRANDFMGISAIRLERVERDGALSFLAFAVKLLMVLGWVP